MHAEGRSDQPPDPPPEDATPSGEDGPHHHHYLLDADEDRWRWRARIRRDPRKLFFYRIGIALLGTLLMIAAAITGPLPGPGGIPLFLLGLAVWASEFDWAQDLMLWFKAQFQRYRGLRRPWRIAFWGAVAVCAAAAFYVGMVIWGIPPWLPGAAREWLLRNLPGLH